MPSTVTGSNVYFKGDLVLTSTMLSGPPGMQKAQVSGTELSRKWVCFSPGSSGIMNPWTRWVFWFKAICGLSNTGSTLFFSVLVFTAVSSDQGTTSLRAGSGANGLLGSWLAGPVPWGTGELNCAPAEAAIAIASKTTALFMAVLQFQCSCFIPQYFPIASPLQAACSSF